LQNQHIDHSEEGKEQSQSADDHEDYYSDANLSAEKYKMMSEMESEADHDYIDYDINSMKERGILIDKLPIRTGCFNSDYMAIGTNSKCLKI